MFIPGGGLEDGESPEEAVAREALEECGLVVRVGVCVTRLMQFVVVAEGLGVEKRCAFFDVRIERVNRATILPGHETLWLGPARDRLRRERARAVKVLQAKDPVAAAWWREHCAHLLDGKRAFLFPAAGCEERP
jgi:8-oxo-dGTP pyrophosphatase MutT (NUDIX family)